MTRRRLAVVLAGVLATTGLAVLPAAHASEPTGAVPTVNVAARQWGCAWLDALDTGLCLGS